MFVGPVSYLKCKINITEIDFFYVFLRVFYLICVYISMIHFLRIETTTFRNKIPYVNSMKNIWLVVVGAHRGHTHK